MVMERRAKIIATLGPSSQEEHIILRMAKGGMDIARLNFSHGTHEEYARLIKYLRQTAVRLGRPVCILQDLQGPKIRVGDLGPDGVTLFPNQVINLTINPNPSEDEHIPVVFPDLPKVVTPGCTILLDDGQLEIKVTSVSLDVVEAKVVTGGILKSNKGINLPGIRLSIPGFTKKDEKDLAFGLEHDIDAIAISFVRDAGDISRIRQAVSVIAPDRINMPIIAKLERPEALENLDEIIELADGVMVARGDLGVEMSPESVPIAQKRIIDSANQQGKIVITATQMLDSMVNNPRPTRAEASDVANAIFDGTDAVMLSGETAIGKYPVRVIEMMDAIILMAEKNFSDWGRSRGISIETDHHEALSITRAARELAHDVHVDAIAVFTKTGRTARLMSKAYPRVPILAFTPNERTYRCLPLYWGVFPHLVPHADKLDEMLSHVEAAMITSTPIKPGHQVVIISSFPVGKIGPPNFALLYTIGGTT
jgi:pyruvate kinase